MSRQSRHLTSCRQTRLVLILFLVFFPVTLWAQNPHGALRGIVQDSGGGRVPGARVVVQATDSSFQRETTSDERGEFRFEGLEAGPYHVTVQAKGFSDAGSAVRVA